MPVWFPYWMQGLFATITGRGHGQPIRHRARTPTNSSGSGRGGSKKSSQAGTNDKGNGILGVLGARVTKRDLKKKPNARGRSRASKARGASDQESSPTIPAEEKPAVVEKKQKRKEGAEYLDREDPRRNVWTDPEMLLFNQLQSRGADPIISSQYQLDFPTLPDECFTDDDEEVFIKSCKGNNLHAIRALQALIKAGPRIRARMVAKRPATDILLRAVNAYIKWAMDDVNLHRNRDLIPTFAVRASHVGEKPNVAVKRLRKEFNRLATHHRGKYYDAVDANYAERGEEPVYGTGSLNNSGPGNRAKSTKPDVPGVRVPPVLFGMVLSQGVMAVCAQDASDEDAILRVIAVFDWAKRHQDVWNALAAATVIITARNYQAGVVDNSGERAEGSDDPDA